MMFGPLPLNGIPMFYSSPNNNLLQIFTSNLITDQILFILIFFTSLLVFVTISIYMIYLKNKKLKENLDEKSSDLREAFEILSKNHKKLQMINKELIQKNIRQKEFIIDEIMHKVGFEFIWSWITIEPENSQILALF